MFRTLWSRKSRPILLRVLIYGLLFQMFIMIFLYRGHTKPEESAFRDRDTTNSYMNVCALPVYDYWHPVVMEHVDYNFDPTHSCDRDFKPYTELVNGTWGIVEDRKGMNCSARCFEGKDDWNLDVGEWIRPGPVDCEYIEAVCWRGSSEVYGYIHSQIKPKTNPVVPKIEDTPSVFVFLFDSMSAGQAKRSLPKTLSFHSDVFEAVDFPFVNKVGENSLPNGLAMWFGKAIEGLNDEIFGGRVVPADWNSTAYCKTHLKNESIFKDFSDLGYMTLAIDDWAAQMVNYPNCKGFSQAPTHHYMHPFYLMYERFGSKMTKKHLKGHLCREEHHAALEHFQQFVDAYKDRPKFTWMWLNSLAHDKFNGLMRADKVMVSFFEKNMELFDNSFVIVMGDHGFRLGKKKFRETEIGKLEINNPYLAVSIPKRMRKNQDILETMHQNSRKLQTHFDTRATLLDVAKFQPQSNFTDRSSLDLPGEKGHSYLRHQPPFPRTCGTLPIPHQYCICQVEKIPINDENLKNRLGNRLIDHVHNKLQVANFSSMCDRFQLREVTSLLHYGHKNHSEASHNYEIIVMAKAPSFAQFHTTIVENKTTNEIIFGNLIRIDEYGDTGDCTKDRDFEKLCYCNTLSQTQQVRHRLWSQFMKLMYWFENLIPTFISR